MTIEHLIVWLGIIICIAQSALFSGLNLALFSISRLKLEIAADVGNADAIKVRNLRRNSNLALATIIWGNVASNVILTLLSGSVLTGVIAFVFSTAIITCVCEIAPQAYFSRHSLHMTARFLPILIFYSVVLFPVAFPTKLVLNWWLGPEGISLLRERDVRALIARHVEAGGEMSRLEGIGARNFLDLDDIPVSDEGEPVDPKSIISLPFANGHPVLPPFEPRADDPFLCKIQASQRKWVIIVNDAGAPACVLDAHHFLRDAFFGYTRQQLETYLHRPIVVTDRKCTLGDVIGRLTVVPRHPGDDVVDNDIVLLWADQRRVITGSDLLGRLFARHSARRRRRLSAREPSVTHPRHGSDAAR